MEGFVNSDVDLYRIPITFAVSRAVPGMSCIMPNAPELDLASGINALS